MLDVSGLATTTEPPRPVVRRKDCWFTPDDPNDPNTHHRDWDPEVVVFHWTGGENPAERVCKTLRKRRLSIHAVIERDGMIVQTADWGTTACAHVGSRKDRPVSLNLRSIGIEMVSRGFATASEVPRNKGLRKREASDFAVRRPVYDGRIGKKTKWLAGFTHAQMLSAMWLADALTATYRIPRIVPWTYGEADHPQARALSGGDFAVPLHDRQYGHGPKGRRAAFKGVLGHYNVHVWKWDPGPQLLDGLWDRGYHPGASTILEAA